uniref:Uncharacterized protein n=1 Tax=Timema cristinae TaxID=61476 RepID=A0A7R9GQ35_TIMCR|nr:unnamed protein product [Timema cristinae]
MGTYYERIREQVLFQVWTLGHSELNNEHEEPSSGGETETIFDEEETPGEKLETLRRSVRLRTAQAYLNDYVALALGADNAKGVAWDQGIYPKGFLYFAVLIQHFSLSLGADFCTNSIKSYQIRHTVQDLDDKY